MYTITISYICVKRNLEIFLEYLRFVVWFLEKAKSLYSNILGFKLTVWKESPFNKNNQEIVEIYKKFGFVYTKTEKYSSKKNLYSYD